MESAMGERSPDTGAGATVPKHRTACDACKRMKIKCEWENGGTCTRCTARRLECSVTAKERKKRQKRKDESDGYLTQLEDRLKRMEAIIAMSRPSIEAEDSPRSAEDIDDSSAIVSDELSMLKISNDGATEFVGSSAGFAIFSPIGLKWITEVTGSPEIVNSISKLCKDEKGIADLWPNLWHTMAEHEREPLPPKDIATQYINTFFGGYNIIFALFDRDTFLARFEKQYPVTATENAAWYASLNIVFSIGGFTQTFFEHVTRKSTPTGLDPPKQRTRLEQRDWWKWFRNAASTFVDLQFQEGSLLSCQAMCGMIFLLGTQPNPYPAMVVAGAALRSAQSIGLHRHVEHLRLSAVEVEQRKNTFWLLMVMERQVIMRAGRPSLIHDDDIGIELPRHVSEGGYIRNHIRYMSELVLIMGKSYRKLYAAKANSMAKLERLKWVGALDEELSRWKSSLPPGIQPGVSIEIEQLFLLPVIMMHFTYYNALTIIHRSSWHPRTGEDVQPRDSTINPRAYASASICVNAARSIIKLLKVYQDAMPVSELGVLRIVDYYPLTASLTLFSNILQNPLGPEALSDVGLMSSVAQFLYDTSDEEDLLQSSSMLKVFEEIIRLTKYYIDKVRATNHTRSKRRHYVEEGDESQLETTTPSTSQQATVPNSAFDPPPRGSTITDLALEDPSTYHGPSSSGAIPSVYADTTLDRDTLFSDAVMDESYTSALISQDDYIPHDGSWFFPMPSVIDNNACLCDIANNGIYKNDESFEAEFGVPMEPNV